jgi:hypothetical protein
MRPLKLLNALAVSLEVPPQLEAFVFGAHLVTTGKELEVALITSVSSAQVGNTPMLKEQHALPAQQVPTPPGMDWFATPPTHRNVSHVPWASSLLWNVLPSAAAAKEAFILPATLPRIRITLAF